MDNLIPKQEESLDLFGKKLSMAEVMHYNSILNSGGLDNDVLFLHYALKQNDKWSPGEPDPVSQLPSPTLQEKVANIDLKAEASLPNDDKTRQVDIVSEKKNPKRQYIKLPNAVIQRHQHKYRKRKDEPVNDTKQP